MDIRSVQTIEEYDTVVHIQREAWGSKTRVVSPPLLITAQRNGGLVLGAFAPASSSTSTPTSTGLIGFVFGFVGLRPDGGIKHCSHMAAVLPSYQNQQVGYRLKLAQRDYVLAQGIDLITWTFDPLESRNARLNIHKLGATCSTYLCNLYGTMRDDLNAGLDSDRFQVDWHLSSPHVVERLAHPPVSPSLSEWCASGVPLLNPEEMTHASLPPAPGRLLVRIPSNFQHIKAASLQAAILWRQRSRALFELAFSQGYTMTDMLVEGQQCCYLLEKGDT